jgi:soluble lytic murein transglycosylase
MPSATAAHNKAGQAASAVQSPKAVGAAGMIALAQHQLDLGNFATAAEYATSGAEKAPTLDDYAHYIREQAEYGLKNYSEASKSATHVFNQVPVSPLVGPAAALAVRAELEGDSAKQALELINKYHDVIPQPEADLLLARCFAATGDLAQAAQYYKRVYYGFPTAKEATDAANTLVDIKQRMGDRYPAPTPADMLYSCCGTPSANCTASMR